VKVWEVSRGYRAPGRMRTRSSTLSTTAHASSGTVYSASAAEANEAVEPSS